MTRLLLPLVLLTACGGSPELDQPADPPQPIVPEAPKADTLPVNAIVDFITVKNETVEVPARMEGVSGELTLAKPDTWGGVDGSITLALSAWDSGLELRDTRVKETFFEIADHAQATFSFSRVEGSPSAPIAVGAEPTALTLYGKLELHGVSKDVVLPVHVTRVAESAWTLESSAPVVINSDDFGLAEQREALRVLCAHDSLSAEVKVSVRAALGEAKVPGTEPAEGEPEGAEESDKPAPVKPN